MAPRPMVEMIVVPDLHPLDHVALNTYQLSQCIGELWRISPTYDFMLYSMVLGSAKYVKEESFVKM
jgi:hypothetical protein